MNLTVKFSHGVNENVPSIFSLEELLTHHKATMEDWSNMENGERYALLSEIADSWMTEKFDCLGQLVDESGKVVVTF